jgi:hypothetical protein
VATDIVARGIDVEALGHVVNFDVPGQPEDYIHRVGRTARAETTGDAFTFVSPEEAGELRAIERAIGKRLPQVLLPGFDYRRPRPRPAAWRPPPASARPRRGYRGRGAEIDSQYAVDEGACRALAATRRGRTAAAPELTDSRFNEAFQQLAPPMAELRRALASSGMRSRVTSKSWPTSRAWLPCSPMPHLEHTLSRGASVEAAPRLVGEVARPRRPAASARPPKSPRPNLLTHRRRLIGSDLEHHKNRAGSSSFGSFRGCSRPSVAPAGGLPDLVDRLDHVTDADRAPGRRWRAMAWRSTRWHRWRTCSRAATELRPPSLADAALPDQVELVYFAIETTTQIRFRQLALGAVVSLASAHPGVHAEGCAAHLGSVCSFAMSLPDAAEPCA